ncbi:MAG: class I SAM-dependent methyltransferase [Bacteroidales bacterium]|nr:class I SAM-dependent methyltransferase [Bacteroidales bacterium]
MKKTELIKLLIKHPVSIFKKGIDAQQEKLFIDSLISDYKIDRLPTIDLLELFPGFEETLTTYSFLEGTSLITDIMLLKKLAKSYPECNYLEIGSWRGESIINVSEVSTHCTSVTLPPSEMNTDKRYTDVHGVFSKNAKNLTEILHNSHTFDFNTLDQKFDLIFIDGDHSYKGVLNDTKKTFNLRKDSNSVIVWHDYGVSTETVRHSVLKAILDGIPPENHKYLYHVSNTICAVYIENRNFSCYRTEFPTFPNKKFSVQVKAGKI